MATSSYFLPGSLYEFPWIFKREYDHHGAYVGLRGMVRGMEKERDLDFLVKAVSQLLSVAVSS